MTTENYEAEIKYRIGEFIFIEMLRKRQLSRRDFRKLRDRLIDLYHPVIGELERGQPCEERMSLK